LAEVIDRRPGLLTSPRIRTLSRSTDIATLLGIASVLGRLLGLALSVNGCVHDFEESVKLNGSAIRQTVSTLQYGFGFTLTALSAILFALAHRIK
jgi:hypothetical protein